MYIILKYAPLGNHIAFEPIPGLNKQLRQKYSQKNVELYNVALSDENAVAIFHVVKNAPAYSGLKQRKYAVAHPEIEQIEVDVRRMDEMIEGPIKRDFIKIDVEGAELGVLKGAEGILKRDKPLVLFEFGKGASDFYQTTSRDIYDFLVHNCGLHIYTLSGFLKSRKPLSLQQLGEFYTSNREYYFVAGAHNSGNRR